MKGAKVASLFQVLLCSCGRDLDSGSRAFELEDLTHAKHETFTDAFPVGFRIGRCELFLSEKESCISFLPADGGLSTGGED